MESKKIHEYQFHVQNNSNTYAVRIGIEVDKKGKIKLSIKKTEVQKILLTVDSALVVNPQILIKGEKINIDWGDQCYLKIEKFSPNFIPEHYYNSDNRQEYTIKITGENITSLSVQNCGVTAIKMFNCTDLYTFNCKFNHLKEIDISGCKELEIFNCSGNEITEIKLGKLPYLKDFKCSENKLEKLEFKKNPSLENLNCKENQLITLDLTRCKNLLSVDCSKNLLSEDSILLPITENIPFVHHKIIWDNSNEFFTQKLREKGWILN